MFLGLVIPLAPAYPASLLQNGGFEQTRGSRAGAAAANWQPYGSGYQLDLTIHHAGRASLMCHSTTDSATYGASQLVTLHQKAPLPIDISGWSKAAGIDGASDADYAVYADLTYTDGTPLWAQVAPFATGTHGWQYRHLIITPDKPLRDLRLYALFRNHQGTVWFDDFDVRTLSAGSLFDEQAIAPANLGFQPSGWFLRDVAAGSLIKPLQAGKTLFGVRIAEQATQRGVAIARLTVQNTTKSAKAISIYYVERVTGTNPVWWNDIRSKVSAGSGWEYANLSPVSVGATGSLSLYPFGCVTTSSGGRALGIPPDCEPRVARIVYNSSHKLFFVVFDLALTPRGDSGGHDRAQVAVVRYDVDPRWGFRDAAAKFYAFFPDAFARRAKADGIWMPFTAPSTIANVADFHFAYHEGDNSIDSDRKSHILSFRYVEPMTYWMPMAAGVPRTYAAALAQVNQETQGTDPATQHQAQAVLFSGSKDKDGRFNIQFRDAPWCDGAVWVLNPNPALPHPPGAFTKGRIIVDAEPKPAPADDTDGEYLDSLEAWTDVLDYRPLSLRCADMPLTFSSDDFRPVIPTWFSVYQATQYLSRDLHRKGKLLMANSTPWGFTVFGPLLDVMGTETNMFDNGKFEPEPDSRFDLRRTLCDQKPYLLLMNTDFSKVSSAGIEQYFQRCLFYDLFPSMFSADAATSPYWENPALYNRDRPLFEKYIPMFSRLSEAGWQPVTWAVSNRPDIGLERYGSSYLTVLNSADTPATASIQVDARRIWPHAGIRAGATRLVVTDAFTGRQIAQAPVAGSSARFPISLRGGETQVLQIALRPTQ